MESTEKEIKVNDTLTVVIKPLSAYESILADEIAGGGEINQSKVNKIYTICSIRSINGTKVNPLRNKVEFADLAQRISLPELLKLVLEVSNQMSDTFDDALKNELAAQGSGL